MKRNQQSVREFRQQRKVARGLKRGMSRYAAKVSERVGESESLQASVTPVECDVFYPVDVEAS